VAESEESCADRWKRRLWHGGFGAFVGALLGLIAAASLHGSLAYGVLCGAIGGSLLGFFLGLDALGYIIHDWPFGP
jgi:hypothetical protein